MRLFLLFIILISLSGCTTIKFKAVEKKPVDEKIVKEVILEVNPLTKISSVQVGMLLAEVKSIMGDSLVIGYQRKDENAEDFKEITLDSPYRAEELIYKKKSYVVLYYFTSVNSLDGLIGEDELTPLVFLEEKLIGKGWVYLFDLKNKDHSSLVG